MLPLLGACSNEAPVFMGSGGTGGSGGATTGNPIAGAFDGFLYLVPCYGSGASGFDCSNTGCVAGSVTQTLPPIQLGGVTGQVYDMTFHVRGVVEGYLYDGGTRDQGAMLPMKTMEGNDFFQRGGMPLAMGASGYDYNTFQLDVAPPVAGEPNRYFFNSIPITPLDATLIHLTFIIDYEKTIKITGGGTLTFSSFDSNCRLIMNCETSTSNQCANHWTVPGVAGAMPPPPTSFTQPYTNGDGKFGQWMHVDVTDVTAAAAP
jgi:hypothetical protein